MILNETVLVYDTFDMSFCFVPFLQTEKISIRFFAFSYHSTFDLIIRPFVMLSYNSSRVFFESSYLFSKELSLEVVITADNF